MLLESFLQESRLLLGEAKLLPISASIFIVVVGARGEPVNFLSPDVLPLPLDVGVG